MALALPRDLTDRGYILIVRADGSMFAVSRKWGCTTKSRDLRVVIRRARAMIAWCEYMNKKRRS